MNRHPPLLAIIVIMVMACYLGWSLYSGILRIRGVAEPIKRDTNPRDYWFYMGLILLVFSVLVLTFAFMFF